MSKRRTAAVKRRKRTVISEDCVYRREGLLEKFIGYGVYAMRARMGQSGTYSPLKETQRPFPWQISFSLNFCLLLNRHSINTAHRLSSERIYLFYLLPGMTILMHQSLAFITVTISEAQTPFQIPKLLRPLYLLQFSKSQQCPKYYYRE